MKKGIALAVVMMAAVHSGSAMAADVTIEGKLVGCDEGVKQYYCVADKAGRRHRLVDQNAAYGSPIGEYIDKAVKSGEPQRVTAPAAAPGFDYAGAFDFDAVSFGGAQVRIEPIAAPAVSSAETVEACHRAYRVFGQTGIGGDPCPTATMSAAHWKCVADAGLLDRMPRTWDSFIQAHMAVCGRVK